MSIADHTGTALQTLSQMGAPIVYGDDPWDEPEALGGQLPPVQPMSPEMLPEALRTMVEDVADRMQTPLDFPAVVAVATLAGLVNRRAIIQPKREDTSWLVVPNLWGAIVAEPGSMKSPTLSSITTAAKELEREWQKEHEIAMQAHQVDEELAQIALQAWKEQCRKTLGHSTGAPARPNAAPQAPAQRRLITSDATFESLHSMLANNPAGLFVIRDELAGWLAQLERQGREQERTFYLEAWNGDQPYTLDRIGRGSIRVDHTCVSLFGGIQPSRLRHYLADALRGGPGNDGLIQRFQLMVWPDPVKQAWRYIDRRPDAAAQSQAASLYRRLALMDSTNPLTLRFNHQGQQLFIAWLTELEARLKASQTGEVMRAHLAKYRKLMPALSLLFALADGETELVSLRHAQLAASWCDYLETHAQRIYSAQASPEQAAAFSLGQKLAGGLMGSLRFSLRDLYRKHWTGLSTPDETRPALRTLEELKWIRRLPEPAERNRHRSETYTINPLLEASHADC